MSNIVPKNNGIGSIKRLLTENAQTIILDDLRKDMSAVAEEISNQNSDMLLSIQEQKQFALSAIAPQDFAKYQNDRKKLSKMNYSFPCILNLGLLKSWHTTPSNIMSEDFFSKLPFLIPVEHSHLAFYDSAKHQDQIFATLELAGLKMISSLPDALVQVLVIDKNGLGQNFKNIISFNKKILLSIFSDDTEIDRAMSEMRQNMSTVTQSISQKNFQSIEDYNNNTDEVAQPYRLVFISNFPSGFSKKSAEALMSILETGTNAGIHVFMTFAAQSNKGLDYSLISNLTVKDFTKNTTLLSFEDAPHEYVSKGKIPSNVELQRSPLTNEKELKSICNTTYKIVLEQLNPNKAKAIIDDLNQRIEKIDIRPPINILKTIPGIDKFWTKKASKGFSAPFAKVGTDDLYISFGINHKGADEPTHHGLIGGVTGSGKTVVLNDIILQGCVHYSPDELEFWLLDYKEGTEFAIYKDFPYIKILSMESEIEFGQQVLAKAIKTIEERGNLFKKFSASNLYEYNTAVEKLNRETGTDNHKKLPRIVIIIDEFQHLFPANKTAIISKTNELMDDILRRGRSFGINLLLATQTIKGVDMNPSLMSNIALRIALKMDEKDAMKIFNEDNLAPRYLKFAGQGIYNNQSGISEANVPFQALYSPDESVKLVQEKVLEKISASYSPEEISKMYETRFVYNGETESSILTNKEKNTIHKELKAYIGEPAGLIFEHTYLELKRDYAENFLMTGSDIMRAGSLTGYILEQMARSEKNPTIYFGNFNSGLKDFFEDKIESINSTATNKITIFNNIGSGSIVGRVYDEFLTRMELVKEKGDNSAIQDREPILLNMFFIESSSLFKESYGSDSPKSKLFKMIKDGASELSIHIMIFASNYNALIDADIASNVSKFNKKVIFNSGNGIKTLGDLALNIEMSKSVNTAIYSTGQSVNNDIQKFKPYIDPKIKRVLEYDK